MVFDYQQDDFVISESLPDLLEIDTLRIGSNEQLVSGDLNPDVLQLRRRGERHE